MKADVILVGGQVFCGLVEGSAQALALSGDRVMAVGSNEDIMALRGPETRVLDLAGRLAVPAFNEAHMHVTHVGLALSQLNLRPEAGVRSVDQVLDLVRQAAANARPGDWIRGRGYDHNELAERRHPTREELDRAAPNNPVYLERTCTHVAVANSAAVQLAGIGPDSADPAGGLIEKKNGELTGLLAEKAMRLIVNILPKLGRDELVTAIRRAGEHLLSQGFTSAMDAAVGNAYGMAELEAYEYAADTQQVPVRTWMCLYGEPGEGIIEEAHAAGFRFGLKRGLIRFGAAKVFTDGSAGGLTAAMSEPYLIGDEGNRGILCWTDAELREALDRCNSLGYQLAIHAIGDVAIEQVLSSMEQIAKVDPGFVARRPRIEHCGFTTSDQIARMAKARITPVPQPSFMYEFGSLYAENIGEARAAAGYPMRSWFNAGLMPSASSDAPVCATDPFAGLYNMITRRTKEGRALGRDQSLSIAEAIHAYTYAGAHTQFAERDLGRLVSGHLADIAVLSRNILEASPEEILRDTRCDLTIRGGEIVFDRLSQGKS